LSFHRIILLVLKVTFLLIPLGPLLLKCEQLLGLLGLSRSSLPIELTKLELVVLSLLVKEPLVLSKSGVSLALDCFELILKPLAFLKCLLESFFKSTLLRLLRF
jgi:hypothetical protein